MSRVENESDTEGPERFLTLQEVIKILAISKATFYRQQLHLLALPIGGVNRYRLSDILRELGYEDEQ